MKREEVTRIVRSELEHIPKGPKGSPQNVLRFCYNVFRRRDLGRDRTKEQTLRDAIERTKRDHPEFKPEFDEEFFKMPEEGLLKKLFGWIKR